MRRVRSLVLALIIAAHGAAAEERERTSKDCDPVDRTYFPVEEPGSDVSGLDNFYCIRFSMHLRFMDEPPLLGRERLKNAEAYRLLVTAEFKSPYLLRLEPAPGGGWLLIEKATDGRGSYTAGEMVLNNSRQLTETEAMWITDSLRAIDLESTPTDPDWWIIDPETGERTEVVNASRIAFEVVRDKRYRVFVRVWRDGMMEPQFERLMKTFRTLSPNVDTRNKRRSPE